MALIKSKTIVLLINIYTMCTNCFDCHSGTKGGRQAYAINGKLISSSFILGAVAICAPLFSRIN